MEYAVELNRLIQLRWRGRSVSATLRRGVPSPARARSALLRRLTGVVGRARGRPRTFTRVWIDVGAHRGDRSFAVAARDPRLLVYAFEPNLAEAATLMGRLNNFVLLPLAVSEVDGQVTLLINRFSAASSTLEMDPVVRAGWRGGEELAEVRSVRVPSIRLDTFITAAGITHVDFLKVDTQGLDLEVLRSAGSMIRRCARIEVEAPVGAPLYKGGATREGLVDYLTSNGFTLVSAERQSHDQEENLTFTSTDDRRSVK